jgi:hypothetical protein
MFGRRLPRANYANVTASFAIFVALGGTGVVAVGQPANGSVTTPELARPPAARPTPR